jgi:hypothetical protein
MAQPIEMIAAKVRENKRTVAYDSDEAEIIVQKLALIHAGVQPGEWPGQIQVTIQIQPA